MFEDDSRVTVSVVIPAYNVAAFIGRTLDTVRAQTLADHETIVVDDGSTDETANVVRAYFTQHGVSGRVICQENRGMAAARNTGMRAAGGSYIALLDADDLWYPEKLATVMAEFTRHPDVDLICHDENITRDSRVVRVTRRKMPRGDLYESLLFDGNILSPSAATFRRDAALALGGFDERAEYLTVEDYDFWMRFSRERRIRFLDRVLGEYVLLEGSASRRIVFHHAALELMLRSHLDDYLRVHPGAFMRVRARRRMAMVYRSAARQLMLYGGRAEDQRAFVGRMLRAYPLAIRNIAVALMWSAGAVRRLPRDPAAA